MKMTPDDDKRISAELGVTPGEWREDGGVYAYRGEGVNRVGVHLAAIPAGTDFPEDPANR